MLGDNDVSFRVLTHAVSVEAVREPVLQLTVTTDTMLSRRRAVDKYEIMHSHSTYKAGLQLDLLFRTGNLTEV